MLGTKTVDSVMAPLTKALEQLKVVSVRMGEASTENRNKAGALNHLADTQMDERNRADNLHDKISKLLE